MRGVKKIEDLGFPVLAAGIKLSRWIRWVGIVAAYKTKPSLDAPEPAGFEPDALEEISLLARLLSKLLDHKLLCAAIGLEED